MFSLIDDSLFVSVQNYEKFPYLLYINEQDLKIFKTYYKLSWFVPKFNVKKENLFEMRAYPLSRVVRRFRGSGKHVSMVSDLLFVTRNKCARYEFIIGACSNP